MNPLFTSISEVLKTEGLKFHTIVELMRLHFNRNIGSVRQTISACTLEPDIAAILKRPVGECALQIERRYFEDAQAPAHLRTVSICRSDLVRIESHFQAR